MEPWSLTEASDFNGYTERDVVLAFENPKHPISKLMGRIDSVTKKFFPQETATYTKKPDARRVINHYRHSSELLDEPTRRLIHHRKKKIFNGDALLSVAAIRTIDDFIDTALWPNIENYDRAQLERQFQTMLEELYALVRRYDPTMPHEIILLPKAELGLAIHTSQEYFDEHVKDIFEYKSLDLRYLFFRTTGESLTDEQAEILAIRDVLRDFDPTDVRHSKDFNLFRHISENGLNPKKLIGYLTQALEKFSTPDATQREKEEQNFTASVQNAIKILSRLRVV